jgi:peptidyl-prolyl cis-trans isomerase B (cyclophilin B)
MMKKQVSIFILGLLFSFLFSCNSRKVKNEFVAAKKEQRVEMVTNYGTTQIKLYNETPLHRDNFLKLVSEKAYDSVLFHRVIQNFMIQAGDPSSKKAQALDTLGAGDVDYTIPAEFNPKLFHKKGVLAAAREDRPDSASSGMQFYMVQGKIFNDSLLLVAESRINAWQAQNTIQKDAKNKYLFDSLQKAKTENQQSKVLQYADSITRWAKTSPIFKRYTIPANQREIYKTIGGTPHLDQNYSVFGEVINGLNVVDSIATATTNDLDRPLKEVRILSLRVLE